MKSYDVIVLGVGGMGSHACYSAALRNARVLGLEQFRLGHDRGSSHGSTRMIRQAYFEHPDYVPLLREAYALWDRQSHEAGHPLFHRTGILYLGGAKSKVLEGMVQSAHLHNIPLERWSAEKVAELCPQLECPPGYFALWEANAGYLEVDECVRSATKLARAHGAEIHEEEPVVEWHDSGDGVTVRTAQGEYRAKSLVITTGAWRQERTACLDDLSIHRQCVFWFEGDSSFQENKGMPCFAYDLPEGFFYGFPARPGEGVKIGHHKPGARLSSPEALDRQAQAEDLAPVEKFIRSQLPKLGRVPTRASFCIYTMTPDENFRVGAHPEYRNVYLAAGFSGHGFKFASVMGEVLADLALDGSTGHPIEFLKIPE